MRRQYSKSTTVFIADTAAVIDNTVIIAIAIIAVVIIVIVVVVAIYCYKVKNRYSAAFFLIFECIDTKSQKPVTEAFLEQARLKICHLHGMAHF